MKLSAAERQARQARIAIECRKVRLHIASHPGLTAREIAEATGVRPAGQRLFRMLMMGIVMNTNEKQEDGTRPQRWFVVPQ